jgi:hypothetical protein
MTHVVKPGRRNEMLQILQEIWKLWADPPTYRIYLAITGPFHVIYQEIEFEDFEAHAKFWTEAASKPGFAPLLSKWRESLDTGDAHEFLALVE